MYVAQRGDWVLCRVLNDVLLSTGAGLDARHRGTNAAAKAGTCSANGTVFIDDDGQ